MIQRFTIAASGQVNTSFPARSVIISNFTGRVVYFKIGSNATPNTSSADYVIAPFSMAAYPFDAARDFGFTIGEIFLPTPTVQGIISATFLDSVQPFSVTNIAQPGATFLTTWLSDIYQLPANPAHLQLLPAPGLGHHYRLFSDRISDYTTQPNRVIFLRDKLASLRER